MLNLCPINALLMLIVRIITSFSSSFLVVGVVPELLELAPGSGQYLSLELFHRALHRQILLCGRAFVEVLHMQEIPELGFS